MQKIVLLILSLVFLGCKNGKRESQIPEPYSNDLNKENLELVIDLVVPIDDVFEVYYHEPNEKTFSSSSFISARVLGKTNSQEIVFKIPDGIYPQRLRIDLGKNDEQGEMIFNNAKLRLGKKEYVFSNEEINEKFKPSKFMLFDPITRSIKTQSINNRYDPYFYTMKVNSIVDYLIED